jgi:hypothetical protein
VVIFSIRIDDLLTMPMDRLHHSHLSEDHRAAVLGRSSFIRAAERPSRPIIT